MAFAIAQSVPWSKFCPPPAVDVLNALSTCLGLSPVSSPNFRAVRLVLLSHWSFSARFFIPSGTISCPVYRFLFANNSTNGFAACGTYWAPVRLISNGLTVVTCSTASPVALPTSNCCPVITLFVMLWSCRWSGANWGGTGTINTPFHLFCSLL